MRLLYFAAVIATCNGTCKYCTTQRCLYCSMQWCLNNLVGACINLIISL